MHMVLASARWYACFRVFLFREIDSNNFAASSYRYTTRAIIFRTSALTPRSFSSASSISKAFLSIVRSRESYEIATQGFPRRVQVKHLRSGRAGHHKTLAVVFEAKKTRPLVRDSELLNTLGELQRFLTLFREVFELLAFAL